MRAHVVLLLGVAVAGVLSMECRADSVDELLAKANDAFKEGRIDEALALATKAVDLDPKNPKGFFFRGRIHERSQRHKEAVADFDKTIALAPKAADAYNFRGMEHFKLGHITESIADFDKFLEMRPAATAGHWQRGISYYYAGRYDEGRKQFEGYEVVDTNDVENAVWRYLCMARSVGVDKAAAALLKVGNDRRVPMMQVYALFGGKLQPAGVLTAAKAGRPSAQELNERLFYAHLYLALFYEAGGDKKLAQEHMAEAALDHKLNHYMWDVARVHLERMRKPK